MAKVDRYKLILVALLSLALLMAGCASFFEETKDLKGDVGERVSDSGKLPVRDAKLADHAPRQLLIKVIEEVAFQEKIQELGARVVDEIEDLALKKVIIPEGLSIVDTIKEFTNLPGVIYAEPNYQVFFTGGFTETPNDAQFQELWGLQAINAPEAWETTTGSEDVVIAVIDTGVSAYHPDLKGKVLQGFNVYANNSNTDDWQGHGTHVAGTAGAFGNNNGGVAGVSWGSPILPILVFDPNYSAFSFEIARGVTWLTHWARENPTKRIVANMSLGGSYYSKAMKEALDRGLAEDIVFVVSMGNDAMATSNYPAKYDGVIAVGAMDGHNKKASFSTSGPWISVTAPGVDILSTIPGNGYGVKSGTSMSAPHVSGVVALILSEKPDLSPGEVKRLLEATAKDLGSEGFNEEYGYGLVDAAAALAYSDTLPGYGQLAVSALLYEYDEEEEVGGYTLPLPSARVSLWQGGEFVTDELTDFSGVATFHFLEPGTYDVRVDYSVSYPYTWVLWEQFVYVAEEKKGVTVTAGNKSTIDVEMKYGEFDDVEATSVDIVDGEDTWNYDLTWELEYYLLRDGNPLFSYMEPWYIWDRLLLKPGNYTLATYSINPFINYSSSQNFSIVENKVADPIVFDEIPLGIGAIEFEFRNPLGEVITDWIFVEVTYLDYMIEYDYLKSGSVENLLASPGSYPVTISATLDKADWPEARPVAYKEATITVLQGNRSHQKIVMVLE